MRWLTIAFLRLRTLLSRSRVERELQDEIQFHLDEQIAEHQAAGISPEEARSLALREIGGVTQIQEECRDARGVGLLDSLLLDLRYTGRGLINNKVFTAVAVISLALGIGANTAIFSVVDAVMLRSLPVAAPDELVVFGTHFRANGNVSPWFSYPLYREMRETVRGVSGIFVSSRPVISEASFTRDSDPLSRVPLTGVLVSGEYFETLGLRPQVGRLLGTQDDQAPGGHPVVVISDGVWRTRFDRDPRAVGETFRLNDGLFTIVGVAPREFFGVSIGSKLDFWAPIQMQQTLSPGTNWLEQEGMNWLQIFARSEAGVPREQIRDSARPPFTAQQERWVQRGRNLRMRRSMEDYELVVQPGSRGIDSLRRDFSQPLLVLMGIVGLVLLIACANVANLLLTRSIERGREIAVRASLGAGRGRLIRQLLTESLLLSLMGGAAGLALAYPASQLLVTLAATDGAFDSIDPTAIAVSPDLSVLLFTLAVSTLAGLFFGVMPAMGATRTDLTSALKEQTRSAAGGRWGVRWGRALVIGQTALSVVLLIAAALFVQSLTNLYSLDAGYNRENVIVAKIETKGIGLDFQEQRGQTRYPEAEAKIQAFYRRMIAGLTSTPGVEAAAVSRVAVANPIVTMHCCLETAGYTPPEDGNTPLSTDAVTPGYFRAVGMNLLLGRGFSDRDSGNAPPVVILNDVAAKEYFGAENPVGRQVWFSRDKTPLEVIGVVRSAKYIDLRDEERPMLYQPALQHGWQFLNSNFLVVRTSGDPEAMESTIRRQLATVVPELRVPHITTLQRNVEDSTVNERIVAQLSAFFGGLALLLAAVGLYGVLGSAVSRRTPEFGVRAAFGAQATDLVSIILREGFALVAVGILVGTIGALAASRYVESLLFEVRTDDPAVLITAALLILLAAIVACLRPAVRAASIQPMDALRHE